MKCSISRNLINGQLRLVVEPDGTGQPGACRRVSRVPRIRHAERRGDQGEHAQRQAEGVKGLGGAREGGVLLPRSLSIS